LRSGNCSEISVEVDLTCTDCEHAGDLPMEPILGVILFSSICRCKS